MRRAEASGKLTPTQITYAVAEEKMGPTPNFPHPLQNRARQTIFAVFQTKIILVAQKRSEKYIIYCNFYLPRVKFNWSSPIFGRQGRLGDH